MLAVAGGIAGFVVAALVSTAARHAGVPSAVLGLVFLLAIAAVAQHGGVLYALPVSIVTIEAFDWYFLPPLRAVDLDTAVVLGLSLAMAVLVGTMAQRSALRALTSERARGVLAEEQASLRRVATLVAHDASPSGVFAVVAEEVGRVLRLGGALVVRYDGDGMATIVGGAGVADAVFPTGTRVALEGDSVTSRVFRSGLPARIDDYALASGPIADRVRSTGLRGVVGTPIVVDGALWGALTACTLERAAMPVGVEGRLAAFGELVATAISNGAARSQLEQVAAEQTALRRVATLVARAGEPSAEVFGAVAEEVSCLFGATVVGLVRYEADGIATTIGATRGLAEEIGRSRRFARDDTSLTASVQRTGRPTRVDDYATAEGTGGCADVARSLGVGPAAGVPVVVDGRVWGAVVLGLDAGSPPLPADTFERLAAFTDLVGTAIANAEGRTAIAQLAEEQAALRRIATLVARGAPPDGVLSAVAAEIVRVVGIAIGCVVRFERDGTATVVAASEGAGLWPVGSTWPLGADCVVAAVHRTGAAARVEATGAIEKIGRWASVGAPVVIGDAVWGAAVVRSQAGPLPAATESRLASFAELIATAIVNTQARSELQASRARVVAAADETRRRLERNLHDGIQQRLVSLALQARATAAADPADQQAIRPELSQLADELGATLEELREIAGGLHPAILSEAGLGPALRSLASRSAVPIALDVEIEEQPAEAVAAAAYYCVSEALSNVQKHAGASAVEVGVACRDGQLTLSIRDDGVGGADPARGSGIIGLKDRVEAVAGTISVVSRAGEGTTVQVRLPLSPSTAAPSAS